MRRRAEGSLFRDEDGFTTTSMVLSLLVTLALVFTSAQVYRINSAAAEVQDVADAAALAAENQVAEFMIVARFCDAVVLSLSLTGLSVTGLGLAALCTPATAGLSASLIEAGKQIIGQRDAFADRASAVLDRYQEALPFLAAAAAAGVCAANDGNSSGANYIGAATLVPAEGRPISTDAGSKASELLENIEEQADDIREKAKRAEEAAEEANRSKERAFARDCGDNPSYCMYERAGHLAGLSGGSNPLYTSIDAWSFSVALARAKAYYRARLSLEAPADSSLDEQARSALRTRFYRYASDLLATGYVHESDGSFDANIPHLPSNTNEMRFTTLYTDEVYPITSSESGASVMHAWPGCPQAAASLERGSIAQMEAGEFETCPVCGFTAASMGSVAAASTSIGNGFEFHYEAVADEALVYQRARHEADAPKSAVMEEVGGLFDQLVEAAKESASKRISPEPPGCYGAIALVVNAGSTSAAGGFQSLFVRSSASLGPRAAVSASTLVDEGSDEGRTVVNSLLDGLKEDGGAALGAAGFVLDAWSWMLKAYSDGQDALLEGVEHGLDGLPLASASGLGTWASGKLSEAIEGVGLKPAQMGSLKPLLVNSAHVAAKDDGTFAARYLSVKKQVVAHPLMSTDLFSALLGDAEQTAVSQIDELGSSVEIASIELVDGGASIPITIPIPQEAHDWATSAVADLFGRLRSFYADTVEVRAWE